MTNTNNQNISLKRLKNTSYTSGQMVNEHAILMCNIILWRINFIQGDQNGILSNWHNAGGLFHKTTARSTVTKFCSLIMNSSSDLAWHIMQDHRSVLCFEWSQVNIKYDFRRCKLDFVSVHVKARNLWANRLRWHCSCAAEFVWADNLARMRDWKCAHNLFVINLLTKVLFWYFIVLVMPNAHYWITLIVFEMTVECQPCYYLHLSW